MPTAIADTGRLALRGQDFAVKDGLGVARPYQKAGLSNTGMCGGSGAPLHEGDKLEPPTPPSPTRLDFGVQPVKPTFVMVGDQIEKAVGTDTDVANATDLVLQETLFTGGSTGFQLEPDQ